MGRGRGFLRGPDFWLLPEPETEKYETGGAGELISRMGIGLSRRIRHFYGGFLLVGFSSPFTDKAAAWRNPLGWELLAITAVVTGAGIYAAHRNVAVPFHHALLCLFWRGVDSENHYCPVKQELFGKPFERSHITEPEECERFELERCVVDPTQQE